MKRSPEIRGAYADVLPPDADPDMVRTVETLDRDLRAAYLDAEVPTQLLLSVDRLARRHGEWLSGGTGPRPARGGGRLGAFPFSRHRGARPPAGGPHAVGLFAFVAVVAAIVVGLSAVLPRMRGVGPGDLTIPAGRATAVQSPAPAAAVRAVEVALLERPETARIVREDLGRIVPQSVTRSGYTVTIVRAHAREGQVLVGYAVRGPAGRTFRNITAFPELLHRDGTSIGPVLSAWGADLQELGSGWGGYVGVYELAEPPGDAARLPMRFLIRGLDVIEQSPGDRPRSDAAQCVPMHDSLCSLKVEDAFQFDLDVPVEREAPDYAGDEAIAAVVLGFLDERQFSINEERRDPERSMRHERAARTRMAPEYSAGVEDLRDLDLPNVPSWVHPGDEQRSAGGCRGREARGGRAWMECGWLADGDWDSGRQLWRRILLTNSGGRWLVSGVEAAADSPQSAGEFRAGATPVAATPVPEGLPSLEFAFRSQHATRWVLERGRPHRLDLSQTRHGVTVSVRLAWAQAEYVILGATVAGLDGRAAAFAEHPRLYDSSGKELTRAEGGWGYQNASVLWFNTPGLDPGQERIELRLVVPAVRADGETLPGPYAFDLAVSISHGGAWR